MAQSALTVTPPCPTPPTNMAFTGVTGPNPPNYTKTTYANVNDFTAVNSPVLYLDGRPDMTMPGVGVNPNPPPWFDDGSSAGNLPNSAILLFAANTAALASGTGATAGGTEGTYPGTGTGYANVNNVGVTPASTSVAHEGAGTEISATATYAAGVLVPGSGATYIPAGSAWAAGDPGGPMRTFGCGPTLTVGTMPTPNGSHASSLSKATNPALTTIAPTTAVSGTGTTALTAVTGTNFTPQSVVYANGVAIPSVYVSATTLTATMPKKATAGTWPITVVTGGVVVTAPQTFTWT